jgi:hypothetical protein
LKAANVTFLKNINKSQMSKPLHSTMKSKMAN